MILWLWLIACTPSPTDTLDRMCQREDAAGCLKLGEAHRDAKQPNHPAAQAAFERACQLKNGRACFELASIHDSGIGMHRDPFSATRYFNSACELGLAEACVEYAVRLHDGTGTKPDNPAGIDILQRYCSEDVSNPRACTYLAGAILSDGRTPASTAEAIGYFERACAGDYAPGCEDLGVLYLKQPSLKNRDLAATFLQRACEIDPAHGCFKLAGLHSDLSITGSSYATADFYYNQSCVANAATGCFERALLMRSGKIENREREQFALLKRACEAGVTRACELP